MARPRSGPSGWISVRHLVPTFSLAFLFCVTVLALPASAETIHGKVVDPQSRPVAGAQVLVLRGQAVVATATTAADGTFGPLTLASGAYDLTASAPGLSAAPKAFTIAAGSALTLDISLAVAARSEALVVSASQVDSALSRSSDSVTVINRADLDAHQITTAADSLRLVPGFGVVQSGGRGGVTSFFLRGGESDYTLVLVDGIAQNAFGGGFDAAHLGTLDIERIEVVRGPQSALYGGGAIGGLVQVITRQGGPVKFDGRVQGGGYGTWDAGFSTAGSAGAWRWGASFAGMTTDGNTRYRDNLGTTVSNADYERVNGSFGLGWSDRADRVIRFDVRGGRNEGGSPGPYGSDPMQRYSGLDTVSRGTNTLGEFAGSAMFGSADTFRHHADLTFANLNGEFVSASFLDPTQAGDPSNDETRRISGRYQIDFDRRLVGISGGAEFIKERADNTYVTGPDFEDKLPINRDITGLFVEARPALGNRTFITAGLRTERIARQALEGDGSSFGRPTDLETDVVWSVNPKVSAAWFLRAPGTGSGSGWTKLHGGAGTGIKPPTTFEVGFTNNPNLKPERSRSFDFGLEQGLAGGAVIADATYFYNRYDDLIVSVPVSGLGLYRYRTDNIANARSEGLEFGASARLSHGVQVRGSWTWLATLILSDDGLPNAVPSPYKAGDPLVRRPDQHATFDITWTGRRAGLFGTVDGRGEMLDVEPNFGSPALPNQGYTVVHFGGSFTLGRGLEVFARVDNLFDKVYEEALGYPALGRSGMIGLRVATGR